MTILPEPPAAPAAGQAHIPLTDAVISAAIDDAIEKAKKHGTTPQVVIGNTPPAAQPDSRIVPQWAAGIAVASIGVGAGVTGLGCAAWLVLKGMSLVIHSLESVTLLGVLAVATPFAGFAMTATAIGCLISKAKKATMPEVNNHTYTGNVYQQQVNTSSRSIWNKNTNQP